MLGPSGGEESASGVSLGLQFGVQQTLPILTSVPQSLATKISLPLLEQVPGGAHVAFTSAFMGSFLPRVKLDHKVTKEEKAPLASLEIR